MGQSRGSERSRWAVVSRGLVAAVVLAISGAAHAMPPFQIVEPADSVLRFEHVPFGVPSATKRIRLLNITSDPASGDARPCCGFDIVAEGGSFDPGQERWWDIACHTDDPMGAAGFFDLDWCGRDCDENSGLLTINLSCTAGQLVTAQTQIQMPRVYAFDVSQRTVHWTNVTDAAVTVTRIAASDPAFGAAPVAGGLPRTVAPGESLDVVVAFDTTRPDTTANIDLLADTAIIGRVGAVGTTITQLQPPSWSFGWVPKAATYTLPIHVHNSSPIARTIASVTADNGQVTASGLVGATLAPGASAEGLVTLTATTPGNLSATVTVAFDTGMGGTAHYAANIVNPTFAVVTDDAVSADGRLDFSTWRVDAPPVDRTFTIVNRTAARQIVTCFPLGGSQFSLLVPCPASILPNASATFTIRLTPSTLGFEQSAFDISLATGPNILVQLDARIVDHQLALSASQLDFPATMTGESAQQSVTIANAASGPITVPLAVSGDGFALIGDGAITIPAESSADVTVEFQPATGGDHTGSLEIGAAGDLDHAVLALSGTGVAPTGGGGGGDDGGDGGDGGLGGCGRDDCNAGGSASAAAGLALVVLLRRRRR